MFISDAVSLLGTLPGNLVYQLTLAVSLALLAAVAAAFRYRAASTSAIRWASAAGYLVAARAGLVILSALGPSASLDPGFVLALNGYASVVGALLVAWALLFPARNRRADAGLLACVVLATAVVIVFAVTPPPASPEAPTAGLSDWLWPGLTLGVAAVAAGWTLIRRPPEWPLGLVGMGMLALGAGAQVGWGLPGSTVAAYLHLGEIFAYPLLAMAGVRSLIVVPPAVPAPAERAEPLPPAASLPIDGVVALTGLMAARTVDQLASRLVEALARAIRVEYCLLITPPDPRGDFAIAAGFDLIRDRQVHGTSLDDRRCPSLGGAIARGETYLLTPERDGQDLKHLKSKLNLIAVGPGLVVPIRTDESVHGALLLLSPYGHHEWSEPEQDAARKIASNLATRLAQMKSRAGPLRAVASAPSVDSPRPESEQIERLAGELQLALQELAELRARVTAEEKQVPPGPNTEAITALAQELRQPLSSMLGYTDLLLGDSVGRLGATQRQFVERVRSGVERMRTLLSDLVQITAIETGELSLTPAPIDLLRCVEEAVTQAAPSLREKDLGLRMDFPDEVPALLGDEAAVIQILVHLINNASGASPEGAEIGLSAQLVPGAPSGFLLISVSDRGEGIAPEDFGRVFEPVYRAELSLLGGLGDSGAGLALVKALSEEMGGRVWIESEQAGGSTLSVLLPLADQEVAGELQPVA